MDHEVYPTNSGNLTFYPGRISTVNRRPTGGKVSESSRFPRGKPISYLSNKPTGFSTIPIPEYYCKRLTHTPILVKYQPTRGPKRLS